MAHLLFKNIKTNVKYLNYDPAWFRLRWVRLLAMTCGCLLWMVGCDNRAKDGDADAPRKFVLEVSGRHLPQSAVTMPVVFDNLLFFADKTGAVISMDSDFKPRWNVALTNQNVRFENSGCAADNRVFLASMSGGVYCFDYADGSIIWQRNYDASFANAPIAGTISARAVLWLLSASDGVVFCVNAADGELIWQSEATNRSDGGAVVWNHIVVYGNCDGAAHLFNACDGSKIAVIPVGESDQMAGTPFVTADGLLYIGTRGGRLAVVDLQKQKLLTTYKISDEEAFVTPTSAFDGCVAVGTDEGDVMLCTLLEGELKVVRKNRVAASVSQLLFNEELLYLLAGGNLIVLNEEFVTVAMINLADSVEGLALLRDGSVVTKGDNTLVKVKGEWK